MRPATLPGDQLGNFEVVAPLAEGGMAKLFLARVGGIGAFERYIVLKLLSAEMEASSEGVEMFLEEARVLAALNHQNIAQILGIGRDNDRYFLAMEYVHGRDARDVLVTAARTGHPLAIEFGVAITARIAAGLEHAHQRCDKDGAPLDIIHRDVSPSNVMIGYDGAIKLIDFGIAKSKVARQETQSGTIKGKFSYMSPEQARGRTLDARSDIFALGILLYELTTQRPCFRADADFDILRLVTAGTYAAPEVVVPGYPPGLAAIVARAMQVEPDERFQSAGALLEALEALAAEEGWVLSATRVAATMRTLYGVVPEPWDAAATPPPAPPTDASAALRLRASMAVTADMGPDTGSDDAVMTVEPIAAPPAPVTAPPSTPNALRDTTPEEMDAIVVTDAPPLRRTTLPELILFGFSNEPPPLPENQRSPASVTGSLPVVRFAGPARSTSGVMRVVNVTTMAPVTPVVQRSASGATSVVAPPRGRRLLWLGAVAAIVVAIALVVLLR